MRRLVIEVDQHLFRLLENAARAHHLSIEAECRRRLGGAEVHSRYLQALLAELRADEDQRRVNK
ncbi:hypothetical protein [Pseudomonas sp. BP8]|uniref:hypothetical protein n=1 Tax=Pseudomonas sp. BP8 TaxID=2817864 RepID=UPI001AE34238|nr:hypothetical protein [Pseudomonas sp. BP8]MBP2260906.1 hypothetical protein [Pseudomonas sp. BP8]HDS1737518.1 hypothetical protein [Pseudomonas putida]